MDNSKLVLVYPESQLSDVQTADRNFSATVVSSSVKAWRIHCCKLKELKFRKTCSVILDDEQ